MLKNDYLCNMISAIEYKQYKAYTRQDGFIIGLLMAATFILLMQSMRMPGLQFITFACFFATPLLLIYFIKRYRDKVIEKQLSYKRALAYSMSCFAYGALILALASYLYMRFLDGGAFMQAMQTSLAQPGMEQFLKAYGLTKAEMTNELNAMASLRPVDIAFSLITNVFMTGFVASLVIAALTKGMPRKPTPNPSPREGVR